MHDDRMVYKAKKKLINFIYLVVCSSHGLNVSRVD